VVRVHDAHGGAAASRQVVGGCRDPRKGARLGGVRVHDGGAGLVEQPAECQQRQHVVRRRDRPLQRRYVRSIDVLRNEVSHVTFAFSETAVDQPRPKPALGEPMRERNGLYRRPADVQARDDSKNADRSGGICELAGHRVSGITVSPGNGIQRLISRPTSEEA